VSVASEVHAVRSSVALSRATHVAAVQIDGADALAFLQSAVTRSPYVRVGRVRHALLLRDDASVFADAFVVNLGDCFLVLAEGPDEPALVGWLHELHGRTPDKRVSIRGLASDSVVFGVDGPYAWELVVGLLGHAVLAMPYLTLLARESILCLRAGKTGEYGYLLQVPRASAAELEAKLLELGAALDLAIVGREALDVCALESWHFSMTSVRPSDLVSPLTPVELQLQWRIGSARAFVGAEALRARRAEGPIARITCFTSEEPVPPGARLRLGSVDVGEVLAALSSPTLGRTVGSALLRRRFAHPHLTLEADTAAGIAAIRTETASLVSNESLRVKPHLGHTYANRKERA
jgi:glycine cleavage system aminomethyltransferase T